jgi:hypothetical protein
MGEGFMAKWEWWSRLKGYCGERFARIQTRERKGNGTMVMEGH